MPPEIETSNMEIPTVLEDGRFDPTEYEIVGPLAHLYGNAYWENGNIVTYIEDYHTETLSIDAKGFHDKDDRRAGRAKGLAARITQLVNGAERWQLWTVFGGANGAGTATAVFVRQEKMVLPVPKKKSEIAVSTESPVGSEGASQGTQLDSSKPTSTLTPETS